MREKSDWAVYALATLVIILLLFIGVTRGNNSKIEGCNEYVGRDGCENAGAHLYQFEVKIDSSDKRGGVAWNHCKDEFEERYNVENMQERGFCKLDDVSVEGGYISQFRCNCWYLD
jgi:hypothetical protein